VFGVGGFLGPSYPISDKVGSSRLLLSRLESSPLLGTLSVTRRVRLLARASYPISDKVGCAERETTTAARAEAAKSFAIAYTVAHALASQLRVQLNIKFAAGMPRSGRAAWAEAAKRLAVAYELRAQYATGTAQLISTASATAQELSLSQ
jgi:hypothetical protein